MTYLKINNITKCYNHKKSSNLVLDNISFNIERGSFTSILGPSGCGKTTLLRIIAGLEKQSNGSILINDNKILEPFSDLGMVFQEYSLFPWMNVLENVSFGLKMKKYSKKDYINISNYYLDLVQLSDFKYYYPRELSGGMKQRVAIARALVTNPKLLLMDEPFAALDEHTRYYLQDELLKLWEQQNLTILFVTHSLEEAFYLSNKIILFNSNPGSIKKIINLSKNRKRYRHNIEINNN